MTSDPIIKMCGITRVSDALHAIEHGATALGFVFWPDSPRYIRPERAAEIIAALPDGVLTVGVFVNESVEGIRDVISTTGIATVQLHGDEPAAYAATVGAPVWRAVTVDREGDTLAAWPAETTFLLDAADPVHRGGTGVIVNWERTASLIGDRRVILAGGLTPSNVAEAIGAVRPFGVDVSSGVEDAPGIKNAEKVAQFLSRARSAFEQSEPRNH